MIVDKLAAVRANQYWQGHVKVNVPLHLCLKLSKIFEPMVCNFDAQTKNSECHSPVNEKSPNLVRSASTLSNREASNKVGVTTNPV